MRSGPTAKQIVAKTVGLGTLIVTGKNTSKNNPKEQSRK
jgi:hypothetical protein